MADKMNPITTVDRMNANVLLAVTPKYRKVTAAQQRTGERISARPGPFAMKPEYITIEGKRLRFARGGKQGAPPILMLCPLPQSILC